MTTYAVRWRRPGCIALSLYFVLAVALSFLVYWIANTGEWWLPWWSVPILAVASFAGLCRLHKVISRQQVPICPHCGATTDARFAVCRACGREK